MIKEEREREREKRLKGEERGLLLVVVCGLGWEEKEKMTGWRARRGGHWSRISFVCADRVQTIVSISRELPTKINVEQLDIGFPLIRCSDIHLVEC